MFSLLLKELIFFIIFAFTAAGVVECGGHKASPRTSNIVQFIATNQRVVAAKRQKRVLVALRLGA